MGGEHAELLAASIAGERGAFEAIVERYARFVMAVLRSQGVYGSDADDLFQLVFMRLFEHQAGIRDPERLPSWLATTAKRECYAMRRKGQRVQVVDTLDDEVDVRSPDVDADLLGGEVRVALAAGFAQLSAPCQELLRLLSADPPVPYDEVGELLGMPHGSIGPTRRRCLDKLRATPEVRRILPPAPDSGQGRP